MATVVVTKPTETTTVAVTADPDASASLQAVLDDAPDGAVVDLGGGRFRCEKALRLTGRRDLTIRNGTIYALARGEGDQIAANGRSLRRHLSLTNCHNITLVGLHVRSSNTASDPARPGFGIYDASHEAEHGVELLGCTNVTVDEFTVTGVWGDGIYVGAAAGGVPCEGVTIRRGRIAWNGRQGIGITYADGVTVEDVAVANSRRGGIDLEPNSDRAYVRNATLRRLSIGSSLYAFPAHGHGDVSNVLIEDVVITAGGTALSTQSPLTGVLRRHDWTVRRVTRAADVWGSKGYAFRFAGVDNVSVTDCTVGLTAGREGNAVLFDGCGGALTVTGNDFSPGGAHVTVTDPTSGAVLNISGNTLPA